MDLDLTDEEKTALERELRRIIADARYPLSPRIQTLKAILNKIRPEPIREPLPELKHYDPPRAGWVPPSTVEAALVGDKIRIRRVFDDRLTAYTTASRKHGDCHYFCFFLWADQTADRWKGYWEYLEDFSFEVPRRNATRACLEIAVLIRLIDDQYKTPDHLKQADFGAVHRADKTTEPLILRELTNKIIHAAELSWDLSDEKAPKLLCISSDDQRDKYNWTKAEVDIVSLTAFCGRLASSAGGL